MGNMSTNKFLFLWGCLDFTESFLIHVIHIYYYIKEELTPYVDNGSKVNYKNLQFLYLAFSIAEMFF